MPTTRYPEVPATTGAHLVPVEKARPRVVATMIGARFGVMFALLSPILGGLTLKLQSILPEEQVIPSLGLITSLGALAALFFDPIWGRISDRTTSRFGRRRPYLVIGAVGVLLPLLLIALAPNVVVVGIGWVLAQMLANLAVAAHTATLADQLPSTQRGKVSGAIGVAQQAAQLGAAYAIQFLGDDLVLLFLGTGLVGAVLVLAFAAVLPDTPVTREPRAETGLMTALRTFWVNPLRHPDFGFAWISRFLVVLANFMFVTYRLLWLQQEFGLDSAEARSIMATGVLVYVVALMIAGQVAGWISDAIGRRKMFVVFSALLFALGIYLLVHAADPSMFFLAEAILGVGFGIYVAVDLALVLDVLPNPEDSAKDLGVFNIAMAGPQVLAPGAAALILGLGSGTDYDLMLTVAAGIAVLGALAILPVKKVR